jgi:hypothetical protein
MMNMVRLHLGESVFQYQLPEHYGNVLIYDIK